MPRLAQLLIVCKGQSSGRTEHCSERGERMYRAKPHAQGEITYARHAKLIYQIFYHTTFCLPLPLPQITYFVVKYHVLPVKNEH